MKVIALQGDTLDQLCHRHYGKTKGVTEEVLTANPGLSGQVFLTQGRWLKCQTLIPSPHKRWCSYGVKFVSPAVRLDHLGFFIHQRWCWGDDVE